STWNFAFSSPCRTSLPMPALSSMTSIFIARCSLSLRRLAPVLQQSATGGTSGLHATESDKRPPPVEPIAARSPHTSNFTAVCCPGPSAQPVIIRAIPELVLGLALACRTEKTNFIHLHQEGERTRCSLLPPYFNMPPCVVKHLPEEQR